MTITFANQLRSRLLLTHVGDLRNHDPFMLAMIEADGVRWFRLPFLARPLSQA